MGVEVEFTDEFGEWFDALSEDEQDSVAYSVQLLEQLGPTLPFPHSSAVVGSRYALRELRVQHRGSPMRVFYGFDPSRSAILLCGGSKRGAATSGSTVRWSHEQTGSGGNSCSS